MRSSMAATTFEIRIAVLGYVSAGKTTLINALLRDAYGQVGLRRTTAGVHCFRLHVQQPTATVVRVPAVRDDPKAPGEGFSEGDDCVTSTAAETLREIAKDNAASREDSGVSVRSFDVFVAEPLCKNARPDTCLVLVDLPGINEAGDGPDGTYRAYVREHWNTFDCVLVVMDGRQGAHTEENVKLLEFVRDNNQIKESVRTIVVCNKVDDPDDLDQAELVKEMREEVHRVFGAAAAGAESPHIGTSSLPLFVATSAEFAYLYRAAALLSFEQFRALDENTIHKIGRKEVGWTFAALPAEEKLHVAYRAATDPSRIRATNFDALLEAIDELVGGPDAQLQLIMAQMDVVLRSLPNEKNFVEKLEDVFDKRQLLGLTADLPSYFWASYETSEKEAFDLFCHSPGDVGRLAKPIADLIDYFALAQRQGLVDEGAKCLSRVKRLAARQLQTVLSEEAKAVPRWTRRDALAPVLWRELNPTDWLRMCQSLCLLAHRSTFWEEFGPELLSLEDAKHKWMAKALEEMSAFGACPNCTSEALDFNGFCRVCNYLVFVRDCPLTKQISTGPAFYTCRRSSMAYHYSGFDSACRTCCHPTKPSFKPAGFVAWKKPNCRSIVLVCPRKGCTTELNENRICTSCKTVYCLKGSPRWRSPSCLFCAGALNVGRCTALNCAGQQLTWGVLPYASVLDLVRCERDEADGLVKPKYPESYRSLVHLEVPATPSDPNHFGHVAWRYCQFVKSLGAVGQQK